MLIELSDNESELVMQGLQALKDAQLQIEINIGRMLNAYSREMNESEIAKVKVTNETKKNASCLIDRILSPEDPKVVARKELAKEPK